MVSHCSTEEQLPLCSLTISLSGAVAENVMRHESWYVPGHRRQETAAQNRPPMEETQFSRRSHSLTHIHEASTKGQVNYKFYPQARGQLFDVIIL